MCEWLNCDGFSLQIQFVITMAQTTCAVVWPCGFPMGWLYFQISYMVTLIFLFSNFYVKVKNNASSYMDSYHNNSPVIVLDDNSTHSLQSYTDWKRISTTQAVDILKMICYVLSFDWQTYKSHGVSLKKDYENGSVATKNGHLNGVGPTDSKNYRKLRADWHLLRAHEQTSPSPQ